MDIRYARIARIVHVSSGKVINRGMKVAIIFTENSSLFHYVSTEHGNHMYIVLVKFVINFTIDLIIKIINEVEISTSIIINIIKFFSFNTHGLYLFS